MSSQFAEEPRATTAVREERSVEVSGASATTEAVGAIAAIVLAILGLTGTLTHAMMAIGAIVVGATILLDARALAIRRNRYIAESLGSEAVVIRSESIGGVSAGGFAGVVGIVLGILALLGIMPTLLCSASLIVFGAALVSDSALRGSQAGGEVIAGLGAAVLGILGVVGLEPVESLVLVGFLGVAAALFLSGSIIAARMFGLARHAR